MLSRSLLSSQPYALKDTVRQKGTMNNTNRTTTNSTQINNEGTQKDYKYIKKSTKNAPRS